MCAEEKPDMPIRRDGGEPLVEASVVARVLRVSEATVHRLAAAGVIPSCGFPIPGRIRPIRRFYLSEVIASGREHSKAWPSNRPARREKLAGRPRGRRP